MKQKPFHPGFLNFREPDKCPSCNDTTPFKREVITITKEPVPIWACRQCGFQIHQTRIHPKDILMMSKEEAVGFITLYGANEFNAIVGVWCSPEMAQKALTEMKALQYNRTEKPINDHLQKLKLG